LSKKETIMTTTKKPQREETEIPMIRPGKTMIARVLAVAILGLTGGCTASAMEPADTAAADEALVTGNWAVTASGRAGDSPFWTPTPGHVLCAAWDGNDGRIHPGKLWLGTCRYEFGGRIGYASSYDALQNAPAGTYYHWEWSFGYTPETAVTAPESANTRLPVCAMLRNGEWITGKVWAGQCLGEWGDQPYVKLEPSFMYLISHLG
jgi:hypothetical protein